jgi:cob(I)alamin adenosyltransferase
MKIYTRNGDEGETGLLGAIRVSKSHLVIETCGTLDEINSHLGCVVSHLASTPDGSEPDSQDPGEVLTKIQCEIFDLGSRVAASLSSDPKTKPAERDPESVSRLEAWIDLFDSRLPPLTCFILPGGSIAGSQMHLARTVCRTAERRLVSLIDADIERDLSGDLVYLNRLSDLLFVLARFVNQLEGCEEMPWTAFTSQG